MNETLQSAETAPEPDGEESGVADLVKAWQLLQNDPEAKPEYQIVNPYPGLRSFDPAESLLYFGRTGEDAALAKRLESFNVVGVLGGSGSGKSSLVLAGLLPYLKRFQRIPGRGGRWYLVQMRPGQKPIHALIEAVWKFVCAPLLEQQFGKRALAEAFEPLGVSGQENLEEACKAALTKYLASDSGGLDHDNLMRFANEQLQKLDSVASGGLQVGPANLLIVIDQFEEIFRDRVNPADARAIAELIKKVHGTPRQGLFITLTMRSEEMHRCAEHEGLSEVIFASSVQIELLTKSEDLRAAIIEPARRAFDSWGIAYNRSPGGTSPFDPGLVEFLVNETQQLSRTLSHKPDSLPLLQHALRVIWNFAVSRWLQAVKTPVDGWRPEITKSDFVWLEHSSPFRACLDECADDTRAKALANVAARLEGDAASRETAAAYLIDMAFASLARMDDNNRWVRNWASAAEIAKASIIEVAEENSASASAGRLLTLSRRRFKEISQAAEKEAIVAVALDAFHRAGYLFKSGDGKYDVSHEALIRSWQYYQELLRQARLTRDALLKADTALAEDESSANPSWGKAIRNWLKGGKARQAWETLRGINIQDLARLFVPPRWLGRNWAEAQLAAVAQPEPGLSRGARLARIEDTFRSARRWKEWDGLKPPRELRRFVLVGLLPLPVLAAGLLLYFTYEAEKQLRVMLFYSAGLSQDIIERDPVEARKQLDLALIAGKGIATRPWFYAIPGRIFDRGPVEETAFQILDQKARTVLRYMPGRVAEGKLIPDGDLASVACARADKTASQVLNISGLQLKYYEELKGYSFLPPKPGQSYMSFEEGEVICASGSNGELLMRIQPVSVILHSLTLTTKADGTPSLNIVGSPTVVAFYDTDSNKADGKFDREVAAYMWTNALKGGIKYFNGRVGDYKHIQAFVIPYKGKSIYIANIAGGTYQPHVMEKKDCATYFKKCPPDISPTYGARRFENLTIEGLQHTLEIGIASSTQKECKSDDEFCPQQLVLRRPGAIKPLEQVALPPAPQRPQTTNPTGMQSMPEIQKTNRMDLIYVGLPIIDAVADSGHIVLLDSAGNVLQYIVGANAFSESITRAGDFIYSQKDAM
ncbi:MAG: hypothetical protein AB7F74_12960 [Parvibaculaceae bacterium]